MWRKEGRMKEGGKERGRLKRRERERERQRQSGRKKNLFSGIYKQATVSKAKCQQ